MEIDVGNHISEVLYDKDQVSIPGLGGFEANYQSATTDTVQGKVLPPAKQLVFRKVPGNDNFLVKYIKDQHNISYADAQSVVEDYVGQVKTSIENKEIFVFPNIGRLYKDYEQELRFLPDKENFNKASYGLPEVELLPPLRPLVIEEEPIAHPPIIEVPSPQTKQTPIPEERPNWFQRNLIPIGVAAFTIIMYSLFTMINDGLFTPASNSELKVNEPPSNEDATSTINNRSTTTAPPITLDPATPDEQQKESIQAIQDLVKEATPPTPLPKLYSATISVGVFTNSINADRMASTLIREGYKPLTDKNGQSNRVMVVVDYADELELDQILAKIKKRIEPTAEVIKSGLKQD